MRTLNANPTFSGTCTQTEQGTEEGRLNLIRAVIAQPVPPQRLVIQDQSISGMRMDRVNNFGSLQWIRGRTRLEGRKTAVLKLGVEITVETKSAC